MSKEATGRPQPSFAGIFDDFDAVILRQGALIERVMFEAEAYAELGLRDIFELLVIAMAGAALVGFALK